jgi:hypothetical protein
MHLSVPQKIGIGVLTVWPIAYMGLFFLFFFLSFFARHAGPEPMGSFAILFVLHCFTMLVIMGLMVFYIMHIVKATFAKPEMRIIWVILVIMVGLVAMPIYWYMYIWRETAESGEEPKASR